MRAWHLLPALALLASFSLGCSGGDASPSGPSDPSGTPSDPILQTPHPANLTVTPDAAHAASARIPTTGGTLQATGADGTVFTLTIPAGALLVDTTITMTPLADASGLNISGAHMAGVQLEPDGLELYQVATLNVAPPEGAHHSAMAFSYHGAGSEVHRVPLTSNPDVLEIPILHFCGDLIYLGDNHWVSPEAVAVIASNPEDQLATLVGDLFRDDRERALQGLDPDPELGAKLQHILQAFYDEVIEPSLGEIKTDCSAARSGIPRAYRWERNLELLGFHDQFEPQEGAIVDAAIAGLENCFNVTKGECLDVSDPVQMNEAMMISHELAVFGVEDEAYNPLNPALQCSRGWSGTTKSTQVSFQRGSNVTDVITTDVQWEIDDAISHPGVLTYYRLKRGTIQWQETGTDHLGCTHDGTASFNLDAQDGMIMVDEANHVYQAGGMTNRVATLQVNCPGGQQSYTTQVPVTGWLVTPILPYPENVTELSGTYVLPGPSTQYEWKFTRGLVTP
jgi:hypothetical protein